MSDSRHIRLPRTDTTGVVADRKRLVCTIWRSGDGEMHKATGLRTLEPTGQESEKEYTLNSFSDQHVL